MEIKVKIRARKKGLIFIFDSINLYILKLLKIEDLSLNY
ncbi:hypothetical protein GM3708_1942 [Geminocystis sp. NIES-3708]|nr:hypothetical protein GM3708_1942 [Geminocystis sp. NIES-3708]